MALTTPVTSGPADSIVVALAGDAMLGRGVAETFSGARLPELFSADLRAAIRSADLFVLNLECCISSRGERWGESPGKPFFFRAPPPAAELLGDLGVDCVTLANNHALDFGAEGLLDTLQHLAAAGIRCVGAGADVASARRPAWLQARGFCLAVIGATDHPAEFAAASNRPGVAFAELRAGEVSPWIHETISNARSRADAVLFSPHWGPNLTAEPVARVRAAAADIGPCVTLVAGHSAHAFHGVGANVLYDLGDFVNDYASARPPRNLLAGVADKLRKEIVGLCEEAGSLHERRDGARTGSETRQRLWPLLQRRTGRIKRMIRARRLRPDLGMLFFVTLDRTGPRQLEALPIKVGHCHTGIPTGEEARFAHRRFSRACAALGTEVTEHHGRSVIVWR